MSGIVVEMRRIARMRIASPDLKKTEDENSGEHIGNTVYDRENAPPDNHIGQKALKKQNNTRHPYALTHHG